MARPAAKPRSAKSGAAAPAKKNTSINKKAAATGESAKISTKKTPQNSITKKSSADKKKGTAAVPRESKEEEDFTKLESSDEEEPLTGDNFEYESSDEEDENVEESSSKQAAKAKKLNVDLKAQQKRFEEGKARAKEVAATAAQNKSKTLGDFEYESSSEEEDDEDGKDEDLEEQTPAAAAASVDGAEIIVPEKTASKRGVLYIGRIPHGFYEDEMRGYFEQFGTVTRLRVSRNKKTGRSKHYGYLEYENIEVAQIVAETMDNYLLFGHLLQVKLVPAEKISPSLFWGASYVVRTKDGKRTVLKTASGKPMKIVTTAEANWHNSDVSKAAFAAHNQPKPKAFWNNLSTRASEREQKSQLKLAQLGITYALPTSSPAAAPASATSTSAKKTRKTKKVSA